LGHAVQVGSLYALLAIATEIAITHIVAHDEDDIGASALSAIYCLWLILCYR
jgi:hypothetical protein